MSYPSAAQVIEAVRDHGVKLTVLPNAERHNRAPRPFGELVGVTTHHTAGPSVRGAAAYSYAYRVLFQGFSYLPGPLCQFGCDIDGIGYLTGWGRANHAGLIDPTALTRLRNGTLPQAGNYRPLRDLVDGNAPLVGIENMTSSPFTDPMILTNIRITAAFHQLMGWPASTPRLLGHREITLRKPEDPRMAIGPMRGRVTLAVRGGASTTPSKPAPAPEKDEVDMASIKELGDLISRKLDERLGDVIPVPDYVSDEGRKRNPTWTLGTYLRSIASQVHDARSRLGRVETITGQLRTKSDRIEDRIGRLETMSEQLRIKNDRIEARVANGGHLPPANSAEVKK